MPENDNTADADNTIIATLTKQKQIISQGLREKQQRYCELLFIPLNGKLFNRPEAYKQAGFTPKNTAIARASASRLEHTNENVKRFIGLLQQELREKTAYSTEKALLQFEHIRLLAIGKGDLASANAAITGMSKLTGLMSEKLGLYAAEPPLALSQVDRGKLQAVANELLTADTTFGQDSNGKPQAKPVDKDTSAVVDKSAASTDSATPAPSCTVLALPTQPLTHSQPASENVCEGGTEGGGVKNKD